MTVLYKQKMISTIAAGIGLVDSLYLTWSKLAHQAVYCGGSGQCETVNSSPYAEFFGIPIAVLGAVSYLVILALLYLESKGDFWRENGALGIFGVSLVGVLYSAYLTYIEVAVLHAICFYCVISALAVLVIWIVTMIRLFQPQAIPMPHKRGG